MVRRQLTEAKRSVERLGRSQVSVVLATPEDIRARLGVGISAAQDCCGVAVHTKRQAGQRLETGDRAMHPAFRDCFKSRPGGDGRHCLEWRAGLPLPHGLTRCAGPWVPPSVTMAGRSGIIMPMNAQLANDDSPRLVGEEEFARSMGWSAGSVAKAVSAGTLFIVKQDGQQLYPSFFADGTLKRRQLIAVSRILKDLDGFTKWQFFVGGKGSLGGATPLAALREGRLRQVKVTAEGYAQR